MTGRGQRMDENDFKQNLSERTARIETKVDMLIDLMPRMNHLDKQVARLESSVKSAHHRIDSVYKVAGVVATIISVIFNMIVQAMK